ncbi:hypothetical protein C7271_15875 [filamentous cyanobacterium CCP5]|nr:hypothetical protein C7271_15875 [filamentous cyanobacterium CCP5]
MQFWSGFVRALGQPQYRPTALRVALVVGSILLVLNHGSAILQGQMTQIRWGSALLTYLVPYCVNIHGQYSNHQRE